MIENVSALQNRPSKEWAIRAIGAFADIPLLDDPKEVTRYAAYGLRLLHIAAYEFPDFANSAFDLANELNTVLLQAAPYICDTAPKDLSRERIYVCLGAAGSLVLPSTNEREQQLFLACYLRARLDAQFLWNEIADRGDTLMRSAAEVDAKKWAFLGNCQHH
ncbi:hypothetical protein HWD97_17410 [Ochrobactrum sp. C6C9]|uniref:hypothetical protein n=1 Tax=Ochrobactrum sp. C6C9 TaxID=2736662 RepID=UPI0035302E0B|nr:hypothetical protein [Ochrobactrum sp. C6C9]